MWDWGDEGIPEPVLLVRFGAMEVRITLDSTLPDSRVRSLLSSDVAARTPEGVGPGSSVTELQRTYGKPTYVEAECAVFATFKGTPGISFRLDLLKNFECGTLEGTDGPRWRPPPTTRVREVFIYSP
ncbi:MAG: hypothetical protein ABI969_17775 [bacterium]